MSQRKPPRNGTTPTRHQLLTETHSTNHSATTGHYVTNTRTPVGNPNQHDNQVTINKPPQPDQHTVTTQHQTAAPEPRQRHHHHTTNNGRYAATAVTNQPSPTITGHHNSVIPRPPCLSAVARPPTDNQLTNYLVTTQHATNTRPLSSNNQ